MRITLGVTGGVAAYKAAELVRRLKQDAFNVQVVITRGARGASYLGDDERFDVRAPAVEAVDTTGAGDVFAGVLAAEWLAGHEHALRRACAAGALSTLVPGAGDCAPYAEAIDDAVSNRKAGDRHL